MKAKIKLINYKGKLPDDYVMITSISYKDSGLYLTYKGLGERNNVIMGNDLNEYCINENYILLRRRKHILTGAIINKIRDFLFPIYLIIDYVNLTEYNDKNRIK